MKIRIRAVKEGEISKVADFLVDSKWGEVPPREVLEKSLVTQFHSQGDLLLAMFDEDGGVVLGAVMGRGKGDTVSIVYLWAVKDGFYEKAKRLITAEEKICRRYGYSQLFLASTTLHKNFLIVLGYKPRLLFTFSKNRRELFEIFSQLYPLWIEAGGQEVKVLLGGDHLGEDVKTSLRDFPVKTENLFLKTL